MISRQRGARIEGDFPGIAIRKQGRCKASLAGCILLLSFPALGADPVDDVFALSLEELANTRVTSVSKKEERLADTAAAIYVISGEAIRRSGAQSLPEVLRLAPNLQVAQINANQYAISARGFNASTANKLLVMIDGRTVYTPLYSGVFWDEQSTLLHDVDRIEVISGPGGTIWGTNAVNGVINIITRNAENTPGTVAIGTVGEAGSGAALRHAGALSQGAFRLYAMHDQRRHTTRATGSAVADGLEQSKVGFRGDWQIESGNLSLLGGLYRGREAQTAPGTVSMSGANILLRWEAPLANGAHLHVQNYVDHTKRDVPGTFGETLNTVDLEVQYSMPADGDVQTMVGGGYRLANDDVTNSAGLAFLPAQRKLHWSNLFAQQERTLAQGVRLTAGLRAESNDYTGVEWLPSLKLAFKLGDDALTWAGLARVVRAPSRIDTDLHVPGKPPYFFAGSPDFRSEVANTLDLGLRGQYGSGGSYSMVAYFSRYRYLRSVQTLPGGVFAYANGIDARVQGVEAWTSYQVSPRWSLDASINALHQVFEGPYVSSRPGNDPKLQLNLHSRWNINGDHQFDVGVGHVARLPAPAIAAYTTVDLRYGWHLSPCCDLSFYARNVLDKAHAEYPSGNAAQLANPIMMRRELNLTLTARF